MRFIEETIDIIEKKIEILEDAVILLNERFDVLHKDMANIDFSKIMVDTCLQNEQDTAIENQFNEKEYKINEEGQFKFLGHCVDYYEVNATKVRNIVVDLFPKLVEVYGVPMAIDILEKINNMLQDKMY